MVPDGPAHLVDSVQHPHQAQGRIFSVLPVIGDEIRARQGRGEQIGQREADKWLRAIFEGKPLWRGIVGPSRIATGGLGARRSVNSSSRTASGGLALAAYCIHEDYTMVDLPWTVHGVVCSFYINIAKSDHKTGRITFESAKAFLYTDLR